MKLSTLDLYAKLSQKVFPWLAAALVMTALVSPNGGQPLGAVLFLFSIPLLFIPLSRSLSGEPVSLSWKLTLTLPLLASIPLFVSSDTGEALAGGARFFLAGITLIGLMRSELNLMLLLRAASASGMLAILLHWNQFGQMRIDWGVGYLDSAYIGLLLLCLSLAQFHIDKERPIWRLFAIIGIACLVVTTVKTGSRGAWPAMLMVFSLQIVLVNISRTRKLMIGLTALVMVAIAMFSIPSVKERLDLTAHEIRTYYENGNRASSMGYRLDFWHIAMNCFLESPLYGVSFDRRAELMDAYTEKYPQSHSIGNDGRSSSHNEILNAMAKRGLVGVIAILLLYLVPLRYFARKMQHHRDPVMRNLAMAGGSCVLVMLVCGLTEAPMFNVRVGTTFAFILIFIYRLLVMHQRSQAELAAGSAG